MPIDSRTLLKKSIAKAIQSPGNLVGGAVCLAASAMLWNPLPLILWGLAATGWVSMVAAALTSSARQLTSASRPRVGSPSG